MLPMISEKIAQSAFQLAQFVRNEHITQVLNELKNNELMPEGKIYEMRIAKLRRLLRYALSYSPYYQKRLNGINLSQIQTFDDLGKIDPLTKEELRRNVKLITSQKAVSRIRTAKTSGSTGIPLIFPKDSITSAYHYAAMYRGHSWYGLKIGDREARLWGVPVDNTARMKVKVKDYFLNRFREKEYNLKQHILDDFYYKLNKFRPKYIMGYGKMLYEFGLYLKERNIDLGHLKLKMVKYTSENMKAEEKAIVKDACCCPVVSEYGAAETGVISFQCPSGNHHIMSDCVLVEYLNIEGQKHGLKEILITDLNNLSFPIIRYRLGDFVIPTKEKCKCGLPFPLLGEVNGRYSEAFSVDGRRFHSIIFYYIIKGLTDRNKALLQFRVVQKSPVTFCYQLACTRQERDIEEYLVNKTKHELGRDVEIQIDYFANLPRETSGKLRDFVPFDQG